VTDRRTDGQTDGIGMAYTRYSYAVARKNQYSFAVRFDTNNTDHPLVTCAAGPVKSMVDYIIVRQENKAKVCNVKVIPNKECVPKHKLLVMDMQFNTTKRWHKKFEPRVHVWKLKEKDMKNTKAWSNTYKIVETEWKCFDEKEHWQQMKNMMTDTAQVTRGLSKGPCRHEETWWWNEEVAEAVREKKKKYGNWKK